MTVWAYQKLKEWDKIVFWTGSNIIHYFVIECENEESGYILAKSIIKQNKHQQRTETIFNNHRHMYVREVRGQARRWKSNQRGSRNLEPHRLPVMLPKCNELNSPIKENTEWLSGLKQRERNQYSTICCLQGSQLICKETCRLRWRDREISV